jgi:hypothetical protein
MSAELRRVHGPSVEALPVFVLLPPVASAPLPEVVTELLLAEDAPKVLDELVWIGDIQRQRSIKITKAGIAYLENTAMYLISQYAST